MPFAEHSTALPSFLDKVRHAFSESASVLSDNMEHYDKATLPWQGRPLGVIVPHRGDIIPALLKLASEDTVPLHAIARGRSWGLGSSLPPRNAVLLDLSKLDRILDIDMQAGTARIEPGVTFQALQDRLKAEGLAFHLPSFGGPVDASVLANALERGEGAGPCGDRFAHLWDIDVALATGERFRTGHSRYQADHLSSHHARPAGPLLEGLFSQSGFGVVLSGQIGLQPTLPYMAMMLAELGPAEKLKAVLPVLKRILNAGLVPPHALALWNGAKRVSSLAGRYLSDQDRQALKPEDWALSLMIGAPHPDLLTLTSRILASELEPLTDTLTLQHDRDEKGQRLETPMTGFSTGQNVLSVYAGKAHPPETPGNPDQDRCGFLWLCPVLPFEADALIHLDHLVKEINRDQPFFTALGLQAVSARAFHAYVSLAWDRDLEGADARAMQAHERLWQDFSTQGWAPYRLGLPDIAKLPPASDDWPHVLKRLKKALDPQDILSPGRLPGL
jgi:4-cresol dehydrogenase (hydroxylating)